MEVMSVTEDLSEGTLSPSRMAWQSPRISFCQDLVCDRAAAASPDLRKRDENRDGFSTEFEFCMLQSSTDHSIFGHNMSSADELFSDGKLLPLHSQTTLPDNNPSSQEPDKPTRQSSSSCCSSKAVRPSASSLDLHSEIPHSIVQSGFQDPSPDSESALLTSLSDAKSPKASRRWKEIFKISKIQVPKDSSEAKKEASKDSFSLKQPLSPRSIWPFSRSSSAGDAKTKSASCSLASSRSNSAGDSHQKMKSSSAPCSRSNSASDSKSKVRPPFSSKIHMDFIAKPARNSSASSSSIHTDPCELEGSTGPLPSNPEETQLEMDSDVPQMQTATETIKQKNKANMAKVKRPPKGFSQDGAVPVRSKACSSPGRPLKLRSPSRNYGRGSPVRIIGRPGVCNGSPGRAVSGKFMIRNLERCSANPKSMVKSQEAMWASRHKEASKISERSANPSYSSSGVRVLNVPVCIGHTRAGRKSSNRLFNIRGLFSKRGNH